MMNWRKSSCSASDADCVEVGGLAGRIAVRDTKNRAGGNITVGAGSWSRFLETVRDRGLEVGDPR